MPKRPLDVENLVLRSELEWLRREHHYQRAWLRRRYPDVFKSMEDANEENNLEYHRKAVLKIQDAFPWFAEQKKKKKE